MRSHRINTSFRGRTSMSLLGLAAFLIALLPLQAGIADQFRAGTTVMVSTRSDGSPADGGAPSVSADGRYVAFDSWDRLAPEDTDDIIDVYRKDISTGQTVLVSVDVPTVTFPYNMKPSISGDGSKVAFLSGFCYFPTLLKDLPTCPGIAAHIRNLTTGNTLVVSDGSVAHSSQISRDGRYVTVIEDEGSYYWVYVVSTSTGIIQLQIPLNANDGGEPEYAPLSATGRYVAFESTRPNVPSDTDGQWDVYRYDRDTDGNGVFDETGKTALAIVGIGPNGDSSFGRWPTLSDDGMTVAFVGSGAAFLYAYVRDLRTSTTTMASQSSLGAPSVLMGFDPSISGDGRYVGFDTLDLHMGLDANPGNDVFVRDRIAGTTVLASVLPDGTQGEGDRFHPSLSVDGRYVAFQTTLLDLTYDGLRDDRHVYMRDLSTPCSVICPNPILPPLPLPAALPAPPTPDAVVVDSRQATGTPTNFALINGQGYRVSASGVYQFAVSYPYALADANCATTDGVNFHRGLYPGYLDLNMNGQAALWVPYPGTQSAIDSACSTAHHYTLDVTGNGSAASFGIKDTNYSDNAGALSVGLTPK